MGAFKEWAALVEMAVMRMLLVPLLAMVRPVMLAELHLIHAELLHSHPPTAKFGVVVVAVVVVVVRQPLRILHGAVAAAVVVLAQMGAQEEPVAQQSMPLSIKTEVTGKPAVPNPGDHRGGAKLLLEVQAAILAQMDPTVRRQLLAQLTALVASAARPEIQLTSSHL